VKNLEPPDTFHLDAARGWIGLGDLVSASNELEEITPQLRAHPDVLLLRCEIYHRAKKWDGLLAVAGTLVKMIPKNPQAWIRRSFALHKLKRTQEAFDLLQPAATLFPDQWLIPYNLACYTAQLSRLKDAHAWLEKAIALGDAKAIKLMALDDPDLKPLWASIPQP